MGNRVTGIHAIEEVLKNPPYGSTLYLVRGDRRNSSLEKLALADGKTAVRKVDGAELDRLAGGKDHRGAVLDIGRADVPGGNVPGGNGRAIQTTVRDFCNSLKTDGEKKPVLVLVLDGITDPHNLGAILRSADQFSVSLVVVPQHSSATVNETVLRVSSGAARYVAVATVRNLVQELKYLKDNGFWIYGADMHGESSYKAEFPLRTAIVMGSEGSGMRPSVRSECDYMLSIPMYGHIDSLNVSVAAGILMYEYRRVYTDKH